MKEPGKENPKKGEVDRDVQGTGQEDHGKKTAVLFWGRRETREEEGKAG